MKLGQMYRRQGQAGFVLTEVLLATAIFAMLVTAVVGALVYGQSTVANTGDRLRAIQLADEGVQATENIASGLFGNLSDGTYGLSSASGQWTFSGASDTTGIFSRQIVITSAGLNRKNITATVTWTSSNGTTTHVSSTTRLVNWPALIKLWNNAILAGSANVSGSVDAIKTASQGNYAYTVLNAGTNNFVVTDVSNPSSPSIVSTTSLAGTPTNIFVSGNYAYITTTSDTAELIIVDITSPTVPTVTGTFNAAGTANGQGIFVVGTTAYLVRAANGGNGEFEVVNVTAPSAPALLGAYNNNLSMNEVYVLGTNAYIATSSITQEMLVINVSSPSSPSLTTAYNAPTLSAASTITGYGTTILLGTGLNLDAISVAVPGSPILLGTFLSTGAIQDVAVDTTNLYAFIGTSSIAGEFQVVSIAVPLLMTLAKAVDVPGITSTVNGVGYNSTLDIVAGASASDSQEILTFTRN